MIDHAVVLSGIEPETRSSSARAIPQRGKTGRIYDSAVCRRQCVYGCHVRIVQLEVEYRQVLCQSIDPRGSRKRHHAGLLNKSP
jgi:hypothetical protein